MLETELTEEVEGYDIAKGLVGLDLRADEECGLQKLTTPLALKK